MTTLDNKAMNEFGIKRPFFEINSAMKEWIVKNNKGMMANHIGFICMNDVYDFSFEEIADFLETFKSDIMQPEPTV